MSKSKKKKKSPKRVLALPDPEQSRSVVLNTLTSKSGQGTYEHAIEEFIEWYCSEPRLAFNRTVVLRHRIHLKEREYAPAIINLWLAAVRRVAFEAARWELNRRVSADCDELLAKEADKAASCRLLRNYVSNSFSHERGEALKEN